MERLLFYEYKISRKWQVISSLGRRCVAHLPGKEDRSLGRFEPVFGKTAPKRGFNTAEARPTLVKVTK